MMRRLSAIFAMCSLVLWVNARGEEPKERKDKPLSEIKELLKPDAFKTLVNPDCSHCVDEAKRRSAELRDDDRVLAWIRGKYEGGGIPVRFFLNSYRVISDTYGVFIHDHDAGYLIGYEPSLDFTFAGWRNGIMVIRHKDGTLFSALSGKAIDGPRKGERLKRVATLETNWGAWSAAYPGSVAYHMYDKYQPQETPSDENQDSLSTRPTLDNSPIPEETMVLGVELDDAAKAFPLRFLNQSGGIVKDKMGEQEIVVLWTQSTRTAAAYAPVVDESSPEVTVDLELDADHKSAPFRDKKTGSHFDIAGRGVDGELQGKTLRWLTSVQCKWFAWKAEFPQTQLVGGNRLRDRADNKTNKDASRSGSDARQSKARRKGVIVDPPAVTEAAVADWIREGSDTLVVLLSEEYSPAEYARVHATVQDRLPLFFFVEIARNQSIADAHPEWMASLGVHDDWRKRFPDSPATKKGEVAKAYPWVPVAYEPAYHAHHARVCELLKRAGDNFDGLLLNDLQGGPAACGCGNLQCRWAIDYHVPATAPVISGGLPAAQFVKEVQEICPGKQVIPIWVTECEQRDLPDELLSKGLKSTGHCGSVPCAKGLCPIEYGKQWSELIDATNGPIAILALHEELERTGPNHGEPGSWASSAFDFAVDSAQAAAGEKPDAEKRVAEKSDPISPLWVIVQGEGVPAAETQLALQSLEESCADAILVSRIKIDQSFEPRIVPVTAK